MMRVVQAEPPLIEEIDAAFKVRGKPVLFAWGDTIFNPLGVSIPPELMAHEAVHGLRQALCPGGAESWWRRYIAEPEFRLLEEIPAHVDEFVSLCAQYRKNWRSERNMRRTYASHVARRLAAPLYGRLISFADAKKALMAGVN